MAEQGKINLNTASYEDLQHISDVGDECARRIIEEREKRGGFQSIEELDQIGGFGREAVQNLKAQAHV
jgi:competence ComEA-like helix-hairpin-helix protein